MDGRPLVPTQHSNIHHLRHLARLDRRTNRQPQPPHLRQQQPTHLHRPTGRVAVIDNLNERLTNDEEQRILAALTKGEDVDINVSDKEIEEYLSDQQNVELLIGDALQVIGLGKYKYTPADFIRLLNLRVDVNASQKASAKNLQLRILLAHSLANSFAASKHFEKTLYRDFDSHINVKKRILQTRNRSTARRRKRQLPSRCRVAHHHSRRSHRKRLLLLC